MSESLEIYRSFERLMLELDAKGDEELADGVRDLMDRIWFHRLTPDDRARINAHNEIEIAAPSVLFFKPRNEPAGTVRDPISAEVPYMPTGS